MENVNKLYVGTKNKAKISAVMEVFKEFEVIPMEGESGVRRQPLSEEETILGATNRAMSLPCGYRLGLEAGVTTINGICYLINFGVLIDPNDCKYFAGGTYLPLPDFVKDRLYNSDVELKEVMEEYTGIMNINHFGGAISVFTDNQVERKDIFIHICKLLYGQLRFKNKENING